MVFHFAASLPAVAARHHDVEENDRGLFPLEQFHRFVAVVCNRNRITACLEIIADDVGVVVIIVNDKNGWKLWVGHPSLRSLYTPRRARVQRFPFPQTQMKNERSVLPEDSL